MGAKPSSISDLKNNSLLRRFVSEEKLAEGDTFWGELLAFSFIAPNNSADNRLLEEATEPICEELVKNNVTTGNFVTLIKLFNKHADELKSDSCKSNLDNVFDWETYNILLLIRCFGKHFISTLSNDEIRQHFGATVSAATSSNNNGLQDCGVVDDFFTSLINVIVTVQLSPDTYGVHVEAINTLIILLSVQMIDVEASATSVFYNVLMKGKCSEKAGVFVKTLLKNVIKFDITPSELLASGNSGILSSLWSWFAPSPEEEVEESLLSHQSQLLLLILVNHCTQDKTVPNPYRKALFYFHGRKGTYVGELVSSRSSENHASSSSSSQLSTSFTINLSMLYHSLCRDLQTDQTTLLLYLLLHRNPHVASYILSRTDVDSLVLPILELLYHAEEQNSHHIYMTLIVLLILSQDENFNKSVHEITLHHVPWYTERVISNITLGGLLVLVVLRTIQYNMTKMRDKYLHTNCLATLANMSSQFHALHPYVTQRLISLYALLSKKHSKISDYVKNATQESGEEGSSTTQDHVQDLAILEEVLRMVLEIINSCLTNTLHHNPNLIYTLLHRRELFAQFRTHPTFHDIIENIDTVLAFFSTRLEQHPNQTLSVQVVLDVIKQGALQWPRDRLKKFPELKFKYVEEDQPEEFFVPYVWSLVYKTSRLYWNPEIIQLFHPPSTS